MYYTPAANTTYNYYGIISTGTAQNYSALSINSIPYVEDSKLREKGYIPSNTLNYLDFSADINIGDIFRSGALRHWYLGYSIHHRSAIFESVQQFGRIKGGSNFQSIYLQWNY